jgi:hypothetical protein
MSTPSAFGKAEFVMMNGNELEQEMDFDDFMAFVLGEPPFLRFDMGVDKQGVEKFIYISHSGVMEFIWNDNSLMRKKRKKGKVT